ncbi:MAG: zinc-ribbon domain-containing protein [Polyangiaceae bacterium]
MKIICQTCQSKYTVSDEKVQGKTVKIKCRKCGATIMVNSSGASQQNGGVSEAESFSGAAAVPDGGAGTYTVNVADADQRTMTLAEVIEAYNESVINAETYIWADGQSDWLPLGQIDVIVNALHQGAAPAPEASAPVAAAAVPMAAASLGSHLPDPQSYPGAAAAPRAARREVGRAGRDLFGAGGFGQTAQAYTGGAQTADDVATSAPLFSAGMNAQQSSHAVAPVGQRDENSVLFSLSALTAKAGATHAPISQTTASKDDSGLIDLRALSAGASAPASSGLVPDNAALFPLGVPAAPPVASPILGLSPDLGAQPKNRTPIFIGLGLVGALLAVVGVFMATKGGEEAVTPPVAVTTAAAPTPPPVEPTPTAEASAAPTASASATATAVAAAPRPRGPGGGVKVPPKETTKAGSGGATPPAKTPPKSGGCNCPPGDLMCAMKCSTK